MQLENSEKLILYSEDDSSSVIIIDDIKEIQVVNFYYNNKREFVALISLRGREYPINVTGNYASKFHKWYMRYLERFPVNDLKDENLFSS